MSAEYVSEYPERLAFLARILAEPDEDTHRLVYADWLEEQGEEASADYVRASIANNWVHEFAPGDAAVLQITAPGEVAIAIVSDPPPAALLFFAPPIDGIAWRVRRGFADAVVCTSQDWGRRGDEVLATVPMVRAVELTTPLDGFWEDETFLLRGHPARLEEEAVTQQRIRDGETLDVNGVFPGGPHQPVHVLRALWPTIPLDGWKLPNRSTPGVSTEPQ